MNNLWIYLSPHLDDVALSCGGLIWEQSQAGKQIGVWTLCAGDPPDGPLSPFAQALHARWQTGREAIRRRRAEDEVSCAQVNAAPRHFLVPDCIYRYKRGPLGGRQYLYPTEESLFGPLNPAETGLVQAISGALAQALPPIATLVCPLSLGNHVDHQLTRAAAEYLGRDLLYYADYPYVLEQPESLAMLNGTGWEAVQRSISPQGLEAWQESIAAHASQSSTFWPSVTIMRTRIMEYRDQYAGIVLWRPPR